MCKHNFCIYFATSTEPFEVDKFNFLRFTTRCGCSIVCSKCGKQKNRLSKKIGKYFANTIQIQKTGEMKKYFKERVYGNN